MSAKAGGQGEQAGCYCGNAAGFASCCEPFVLGHALPATAEQLMRSRYSAFVLCDEAYLLQTWYPGTRPSRVRFNSRQVWLGLKIKGSEGGGPEDSAGTVEFVARFKVDGKGHRLHELSRFEKLDGSWFYLDGQHY